MPIAIETRYLAATATRKPRIKVSANGRGLSLTVTADPMGREHEIAAKAFRDKFYPGEPLLWCGSTRDRLGDIFCIYADEVKE